MNRKRHSKRPALLALVALTVIWGYNWVVMKECLKYTGVYDFAALLTFGLLFSSFISQALALLLWFFIPSELPAVIASMGTLATPVIGTIAASIELGERPSSRETWGMVLIITALSILSLIGYMQNRQIKSVIRNDLRMDEEDKENLA